MTIQELVKNNPISETILTDKKSYQAWIKLDSDIKDFSSEHSQKIQETVFQIARILKRDPEKYNKTLKSSVSRAKLELNMRKAKATNGKATSVVTLDSILAFIPFAKRDDLIAIQIATDKAIKDYDKALEMLTKQG